MLTESNEKYKAMAKVIRQLTGLVTFLFILVMILFLYILFLPDTPSYFTKKNNSATAPAVASKATAPLPAEKFWTAPDTTSIENHPDKELITYGRKLIAQTSIYFGPNGIVKKNAINGMNCQNCHLDAGTKVFGNNYGSVFSTYPKFRARSGSVEDIYKRIGDCFERSLNGTPPDTNSKEMLAMVAYINWVGKDVPKGEKAKGSGLKEIAFLDRAADPGKGKIAYDTHCRSCHMENGEGVINPEQTAYTYPPLWGDKSYNIGAGLYRLSSFAKYIRYNMPFGVSHVYATLTDEEAWDIAAYVNSQPRPEKDLSNDWPQIAEKPFDHPFGPFATGFDEKQHKYGPFGPIQQKLEALKK